MKIDILRLGMASDRPTLGVLAIDRELFCFTLELPWLDNQPNKSCIPVGIYQCKSVRNRLLTSGQALDRTYDVKCEGRSGILFHPGNTTEDTEGCILLGMSIKLDPPGVLSSRYAFLEFLDIMNEEAFDLHITNVMGGA